MKNLIGIESQQAETLAQELNTLLASFQIHYQSLRGFHWNITGRKFFELHLKFEEYYNDALLKIDEIAERILALGGKPLHTFSQYLQHSFITENGYVSTEKESVELVAAHLSALLACERKLMRLASDASDEGTSSLLSEYIKQQEKTLWMLRAWSE